MEIKCPRPGCPGHLALKPKQKQLGKTPDQLRMRGKKIAAELLKGKTQTQALQAVGYSEETAKSQGTAILSNPRVQKGYCEVLEKAGLTDEFAAKVHKDLMVATNSLVLGQEIVEKPDHMVRARGLDMFYKVRGRYVEKKEITGKDGAPIQIETMETMTDADLIEIINRARRSRGENPIQARVRQAKAT